MPDPQVKQVEQVLKDLRKVTTIFRLYGKEHPNTEAVATKFIGALLPLLDELRSLELEVQPDHLTLGEDVVYRDDQTGSFAEILYREGIQKLTILPDVGEEELLELVRLLSINLNLPGYEEETLISLLWQADLKHIQYEAVQGLVEAVEQSEAAAAGEMGAFSEVLTHILATQDEASALAGDGGGNVAGGREGAGRGGNGGVSGSAAAREKRQRDRAYRSTTHAAGQEDRALPPTPFGKALQAAAEIAGVARPVAWSKDQQSAVVETIEWAEGYRAELNVPPEQVADYWEALGSDTFDSMLTSAMEAILFMTARPVEGLPQEEAVDLARRGIKAALDTNATDPLLSALGVVDRMLASDEFAEQHGLLRVLEEEWSSEDIMLDVCNTVREAGTAETGLMSYIGAGGEKRILEVRNLLDRIEAGEQASRVMDALNGAAVENPEVLVENIHDLSIEQLIGVYSCVARGEHPEFRRALRRGLRHPKPEVRMHALGLVLAQPDETNAEAIAPLLRDRNERVRTTALRAFHGVALPELEPHLEPSMAPGTFKKISTEEMKLLADAYGRAARADAVRTLLKIVHHRRLGQIVNKERPDLEAALEGLLATGSDEGRLAVLRASRSWRPALRRAGEAVLARSGLRAEDIQSFDAESGSQEEIS